jgi:hypothetical protein
MSEARRAALLLAHGQPETRAEKEAFAAQCLACRLYASNHDMVIVGLYASAGVAVPHGGPELPVVELSAVDLVLAAASPLDDADEAWFTGALEQLRARQIDVVLIDRTEA